MERNCRVFFQCINQQKIREATCPNNLKFNGVTGRCDNPNNIIAPCGSHSTTSSAFNTCPRKILELKSYSYIE